MPNGNAANAGGAAGGPCKITRIAPGVFQVKQTDMPVTLQLCDDTEADPAQNSTINTVGVRQVGTSTPVKGQPTNITKTTFDIQLPAATYVIRMVINPLPACKFAYLFEACTNPQFWLMAIDVIEPDSDFRLIVV
jgi:hypothetical protein